MNQVTDPSSTEKQNPEPQTTPLDPPKSFDLLLKDGLVLNNLTQKMGFTQSTPIQSAVIPSILEGRDIYAGARTGSGKTVAFLAPIAQKLLNGEIKKALVLSPTRELALQIDEEAMKVLDGQTEHVSIPLYGGVPLDQQLRAMVAHKPTLYIATPGRMIDFIGEGCIPLGDIELCVLDEADRMCDMGFEPQVSEILSTLPNRKQTLMFSATLPNQVNKIMANFLKNPIKIQVDSPDESSSTIEHRAILVSRRAKLQRLKEILRETSGTSLIFTRTRRGADQLHSKISGGRDQIGILHAGFSMGERERTIRAFRDEKTKVLIATDVASRGLDVDHVSQVIHYEIPESLEDYIHRSGRAGRAGRAGITIALVEAESPAQKKAIQLYANKIDINFIDDGGSSKERGPQRSRTARPEQDAGADGEERPKRRRRSRSSSQKRGASKASEERQSAQGQSRTRSDDAPKRKRTRRPRRDQSTDGRAATSRAAPKKKSLLSKAGSAIGRFLGKKKKK